MKTVNLVIILAMMIAASGLLNAQVVQSGTFKAGSNAPGYTLDQGTGDRSITIAVTFDKPFPQKPEVLLSTGSIDASKDGNIRYDVTATDISPRGFTIIARTWSDSKVYMIGGSWIAVSSEGGQPPPPKAEKPQKAPKKGKK